MTDPLAHVWSDPLPWLWTATLLTGVVFAVLRLAEFMFGRRTSAGVRMAAYALVFVRLMTPSASNLATAVLPHEVVTVPLAVSEFTASTVAPAVVDVAPTPSPKATPSPEIPWAPILYGVGVFLVLLITGVAYRRERSLLRTSTQSVGADGAPVWTHATAGPCVVGILRPRVVVPAAFDELPDSVQRCVLAHERAHIRGGDTWILLALRILVACCWPVLPCWFAASRIRSLLELRADATAVASPGVSAKPYGRALVGLASQLPSGGLPSLSSYRSLAERIAAVAARSSVSYRAGGLLLGLGLAALACSVPSAAKLGPDPTDAAPIASAPAKNNPASNGQETGVPLQGSDPSAVLTVDDISRQHPGTVPPHKTHRDGREVELPWPVDADGNVMSAQAWELFLALAESNRIEIMTTDGRMAAAVRKAAVASGASAETIAALLPTSSEPGDGGPVSQHVHVRFVGSTME